MGAPRAALLCALCSGCSVIVSLDDYDRGTGAASGSAAAGAAPSTGGAGGSGASGGAGGQGGACAIDFLHPAASSLVDDFADGTPAPKWTTAGCAPQEVDGQLVATPPANALEFCFQHPVDAYHLTCSEIAFRLDEATSSTQGVQTFVYIDTLDGTQRLQLLKDIGGFNFAAPDIASIPVSGSYDAIADRWWKLRHDGQLLFFETSPDGERWNVRASAESPISLDSVVIQLGAGTYLSIPDPGVARFACYNMPASECP
ncbi:MAG: hypothetical protein WKG00_08335 [Polyangiaceae bacterium]